MRAGARVLTVIIASSLGAAIACSDTAKPLGKGDKFINDTTGQDAASQPPPPPPPPTDAPYDTGSDGYMYMPQLGTCASCSCDPAKNYCFSGGTIKAAHRIFAGMGPIFGENEGGEGGGGPPPPPCKILDAGTLTDGCIPLPPACAATPTCPCLVKALQPYYSCYLNCSPTPGYLEVYCPGP